MRTIFNYHRLRREYSFGIQLCSERGEKLAPGESFETLNTDRPLRTIPFREYYVLFGFGVGTLAVGFSTERVTDE